MTNLWQAKYRLTRTDGNTQELAVSLRRALFTSVEGAAVRTLRIKDAPHEFSVLPGVKEDALELVHNLCQVKFRVEGAAPAHFEISQRGPCAVTAADLQLPSGVQVVDPAQHIADLDADGWLVVSGEIARGTGYESAEPVPPPGTIHLACNFSPVKRAVCTVEDDAIVVSLATDGRACPREALAQAMQAAGCADAAVEELEPAQQEASVEPSEADYGKSPARLPLPPLVGMHQAAYTRFINEELIAALNDVFPIAAADGSAELELLAARVAAPTASPDECRDRRETLAGRLLVKLALRRASGAVEEQEICLGEVPWLTERETFIIDGRERIIVPALQVDPEQEPLSLPHSPVKLLEALSDPLTASLAQAQSVIGELLARAEPGAFDLSAVADFLPVGAQLTESLRQHPCSQVIDEINPLSTLTHLRRVSALGPGGVTRESAGLVLRRVTTAHYGRLCHLESPEGPNIGLVNSLALHAEVGEDGLIRTPFLRVENGKVTDQVVKLTAAEEQDALICASQVEVAEDGTLLGEQVPVRRNGIHTAAPASKVQYMEASPVQAVGPSASLIPFLAHDDANRCLMGANMQRQAVPLLWAEAPIVCSGTEEAIAQASGATVVAERAGTVTLSGGGSIRVKASDESGGAGDTDEYRLRKFPCTENWTCPNERALVKVGDPVEAGQLIAEGSSSDGGRLALGRNVLVAYMPWEGYNFEDAVVISDRLVKDDVLTSLHIKRLSVEAYSTPEGQEEIAKPADAPDTLDEGGIVVEGTYVKPGDILVGKLYRQGDEVEDRSLRVPSGVEGRVLRIVRRSRAAGHALSEGVQEAIDVEIADRRQVEVGDKMSNRHGAKGVVGAIVPEADMPHLPDGTPLDMLLNPLSVPSRMNLGQILETHLGWAASKLGRRVTAPPFCGATVADIEAALEEAGLPKSGATVLHDGRDGQQFDSEITVGYLYTMKLDHLVSDKIHARATGPYSLATQQPLGGRARFGGQRFGEMEVWAAEAYGAGHILQEMLTVKSDEPAGRAAVRKALADGQTHVGPLGLPHSVKMLVAELKGVGFDVGLTQSSEEPSPEDISGMLLKVASPDVIRSWSCGEVTTGTPFDEQTGMPSRGGVFCQDIFGPYAIRTAEEAVCDLDSVSAADGACSPERMGHIELAVPVCHPWLFHAAPELVAALSGIGYDALDDVAHYRKVVKAGAGAVRKLLADADVATAMEGLPEETRVICEAMLQAGTRPEWMVLLVVPVIAPTYRPVIRRPDGSLLSDGLNELYARLVARNEACRQVIEQGAPDIIVNEKARGVQEAVDMLFGNGVKRAHVGPEYGRTPLASFSDRLRSREGVVRSLGKRVDFSGRSVIAPGPKLKLTQCGLPKRMAHELFRPLTVQRLVETGAAADEAAATELIAGGAAEADQCLSEAMKGRLVLLNRAPTTHRYGLQAFEPVLTEHKAMTLHPLVCLPYNADFDGDQMAVHLPLSDAAQAEARELMTPLQNILSSKSGEPLIPLTQDIALGLYYLTATKEDGKGAGSEFPDQRAALAAYESGDIALHAPIKVDGTGEETTTPGRLIFNAALPEGTQFVNGVMTRGILSDLIADIHSQHGAEVTADTLDRLKELGFRYATRYGATVGKETLKVYSKKDAIVSWARSREEVIRSEEAAGTVSAEDAWKRICDLWFDATHEIDDGFMQELAADMDGFNPVYLMHVSGARGSALQLRQLVGMRGLMVGTTQDDRVTPVPINFIEGHSPWQHFVSSYGARRGLMDTALKTADAGYLERKLVARGNDVLIEQEDCGTEQSLTIDALREGDVVMEDVAERALGRIAAESMRHPETGEELLAAGDLIDKAGSEAIRAAGIESVKVRSVLCCKAEKGVCAKCYGTDLATGRLAKVGDAVGVVAAHSIGQPAIQLTLQTFYLATRLSKTPKRTKGGLPRLAELEQSGTEVEPTEFVRSATALFREQGVRIHDKHFEVIARGIHHPPPQGFLSRCVLPPPGETQISVLAKAALKGETDPLAGQREQAFFGKCVGKR